MSQEAAHKQIDELLLPFLNARDEAESEAVLERLICDHAQPLIKNIITFKLRAYALRGVFNSDGQEVEDLLSEVVMNLVRALRQCKSAPREKPIASLRSYVAVMAYNASDNHLRCKYPRRFSLKNRISIFLRINLDLRSGRARARACCAVMTDGNGRGRLVRCARSETGRIRQEESDSGRSGKD